MWELIKQRLKSKTYWLAVALAGLGAVQVVVPGVQDKVSPAAYAWATVVLAIVVAMLRELTTQPLDEK